MVTRDMYCHIAQHYLQSTDLLVVLVPLLGTGRWPTLKRCITAPTPGSLDYKPPSTVFA